MVGFVWLQNPATGHRWQCPAAAAEAWRGKGWVDCDPPSAAESPHLRDTPAPEPAPVPVTKPASRKRGGEPTTAPEE